MFPPFPIRKDGKIVNFEERKDEGGKKKKNEQDEGGET
jgi:hypothetical protein